MKAHIKEKVFITDKEQAACAYEEYARKIDASGELELINGEMWVEKRLDKLLTVFEGMFYDFDEWEYVMGEVCFELLDLKLERLEDVYRMGVQNPSDINISYYSNNLMLY